DASPAEALEAAREAAGALDVRIGGGPWTIRQFLAADLIDHMHLRFFDAFGHSSALSRNLRALSVHSRDNARRLRERAEIGVLGR
ncbi:MAG: hypothetical protein QOG44_2967, partial [Acidimicrobiaceae bacterium]|nr:hypothetical protein [Acidimicrobiaceae bacterium]